MKFDMMGLPKENGATDLQDSARLAGVMTVFGYGPYVNLLSYIVNGRYVRHPLEMKYSFSRDQTICLFAGLKKQGLENHIRGDYKTEGDYVNPAVRGHILRCAGLKSTKLMDLFLWIEVFFHAIVKPTSEPNQLLCMMKSFPDNRYLKSWCKLNNKWKKSIEDYWCGWRDEKDLSAKIISTIESDILK